MVGTFTGYFAGIDDGRVDAPFMTLEKWDTSLRAAGFSGTELVLDDFPHPHTTSPVIVCTYLGSSAPETNTVGGAGLQLLYSTGTAPTLLSRLAQELGGHGLAAKSGSLHDAMSTVTSGSHVVLFLDDKDLQFDRNEEDLTVFQHLARISASLTILTSCGIVKGRNPDGALIPGLLRVLKTENPTSNFLSIDIDGKNFEVHGGDTEMGHLTRCIADQALALRGSTPSVEGEEPIDHEFVWQDGCLWVSRFVAISEADAPVPGEYYSSDGEGTETKMDSLPIDSQGAVHAIFEAPGVLGSLYFAPNREM